MKKVLVVLLAATTLFVTGASPALAKHHHHHKPKAPVVATVPGSDFKLPPMCPAPVGDPCFAASYAQLFVAADSASGAGIAAVATSDGIPSHVGTDPYSGLVIGYGADGVMVITDQVAYETAGTAARCAFADFEVKHGAVPHPMTDHINKYGVLVFGFDTIGASGC
jgi:hypothetical protein